MVKKATPLEKASRMLDLVPFIHSHQGISISELAAEFHIEPKELLEDLQALWMCGENKFDFMELDFDSDYVFIRNADTLKSIRTLGGAERIALCIGLQLLLQELTDSEMVRAGSDLLEKLGTSITDQIAATPAISGSIAAKIDGALQSRRSLQIEYHAAGEDTLTSRTVTPLDRYIQNNHEYLDAHCHTSKALRTFRIDRIKSVQVVDNEIAIETNARNSQPHLDVTIRLKNDLRRNREALGDYVTEAKDLLKVRSYSESWLLRTVCAGLGGVEIVAPEELRESLHSRALEILQRYR